MRDALITAGELRAIGFQVPDSIPDCGNFVRSSMKMHMAGCVAAGDILNLNIEMTFTEPFRWVAFSVTLPAAPANARLLVSRNKREGGYLGWRVLGPMKRFKSWDAGKAGHQRMGSELRCVALRHWGRA